MGTQAYIQASLAATLAKHLPLLQSIPALHDLQASWLLLLFTASPRCNYLLRLLPPELTRQFAQDHDAAVTTCLAQLLDDPRLPATAIARAHLPLSQGGLGLYPASHAAAPAFWASWADALPVLQQQAPAFAATLQHQLAHHSDVPHLQAAQQARECLEQQGWNPPTWDELLSGSTPSQAPHHPTRVAAHRSNTPASHCPRHTL